MRPEEAEEMDAMDEKIGSLQCRLARTQKERDSARALVAELVTALDAIVTGLEGGDEDFCASIHGISSVALAKAKGGRTL